MLRKAIIVVTRSMSEDADYLMERARNQVADLPKAAVDQLKAEWEEALESYERANISPIRGMEVVAAPTTLLPEMDEYYFVLAVTLTNQRRQRNEVAKIMQDLWDEGMEGVFEVTSA